MGDMTCKYVVNSRYRDFYDLSDEHSLNAFHVWVAQRIAVVLEKKYGLRNFRILIWQNIKEDDIGLIADCDFDELDDGSLCVTFSRDPYPNWEILHDEDVIWWPDTGMEVNLQQALARAALANASDVITSSSISEPLVLT
ncbi:hypothetical protein CAter282_4338 [Collimonas arenae]|uniref:Uncharacterized protein n=1 Tax=Collimonas arenae TaxID=279058 RepID=A0A127PXK1_9BURK|nr:hypothetical protein [Collimonas arenae]AMP02102.1 hypothetical protein CAter10_4712 [Collimonas arenae]AMP11998.1 hypothetical protein CAter282_4338 [Collimonas arenae]